jgi:LuxR family maltose regulon positive regulatory protein
LGSFQVWQGRKLIADNGWKRRRAGELFRFLLLQTGFSAGRDLILETFWPDNDPQAAVGLLHQATSTLRHILEPDLPDKFPSRYLSVEGERVTLVMPDSSQVDFLEFEQQITKAIAAQRIDLLQTALQIVRGDLFPTDRYADWSTSRRERITDLYHRGMQALGQQHLAQGAYFDALECSRAIVREDPWNEDAVLLGMQAYVGLRDAPRALRMYQSLEKTLRDELGLIPRSDLGDLALSLRHQPLRSE